MRYLGGLLRNVQLTLPVWLVNGRRPVLPVIQVFALVAFILLFITYHMSSKADLTVSRVVQSAVHSVRDTAPVLPGNRSKVDKDAPSQDLLHDVTLDIHTDFDIDHMALPAIKFLPDYKNPCWYERLPDGPLYDTNMYNLCSRPTQEIFQNMSTLLEKRRQAGFGWRLRCLPYFYVAGFSKSGTSDLYHAIKAHPDVAQSPLKEPVYWSKLRWDDNTFKEYADREDCSDMKAVRHLETPKPFRDMVDLLDGPAEVIRTEFRNTSTPSGGLMPFHHKIVGDASPTYAWNFNSWENVPVNKHMEAPLYTIADMIHQVTPNAKIIFILRDPAERLYSDYKYFRGDAKDMSTDEFHSVAFRAIKKMSTCLARRSVRQCVYDKSINRGLSQVRVQVGMYQPFLADWLEVFPRENIHVIRLEDWAADKPKCVKELYAFLGLAPYTPEPTDRIVNKSKLRYSDDTEMTSAARVMVNEFYRKWNRKLADLLEDTRFRWDT